MNEPRRGDAQLALLILALAILAAALIVTGIGLMIGLPAALIAAGVFTFAAAWKLREALHE